MVLIVCQWGGGACVSIYSNNKYQSYDLDFVTYQGLQKVEQALMQLGFKYLMIYFIHEQCPYLIDFVNPHIAVGNQPVQEFEEKKQSVDRCNCLLLQTVLKIVQQLTFIGMTCNPLSKLFLLADNSTLILYLFRNGQKMRDTLWNLKSFGKVCEMVNSILYFSVVFQQSTVAIEISFIFSKAIHASGKAMLA